MSKLHMSKLLDAIQIENSTPTQAKHFLKQAQYNECLTVAIPSETPETEANNNVKGIEKFHVKISN